jgi:internalin A
VNPYLDTGEMIMNRKELLQIIEKAKCENVTRMNLRGKNITELPPELGQLTQLKELNLSANQLTSLPPELCQLTQLKELYLGGNQLISLLPELGQLTQLKELNLDGNQLTSLPPELGQLTQLTRLYLYVNQLTSLPPELGQLTQLKELYLSHNQLTSLPPELGQLTQLKELGLYANQLTSLPPELDQLTQLIRLDLGVNQLTSLPPELIQLTQLIRLGLRGNQLTSLPPELGQLTQLKELDLSDNQLTSLPPELGQLTQLTFLYISENQLTEVPPELGQLTQLIILSLSRNKLTSLSPELGQLTQLKKLYLGGNQLTSFPPELCQLTQLTRLYLHGNQLTSLPPELCQLTQLTVLYLSDNQLTELPSELRKLKKLEELYLHNNPELSIPPEILGPTWDEVISKNIKPASPQSILDYYFRPKRPLNEAKLILVGFGEVGKTSLVNRLVHGKFDKKEKKTPGIKITNWPVKLSGGDEVRLNVWDFGGQEIMHSTHQFFLSHRSLYILVLNGRQGHEDSDAEYWLNLIRSFGGDSPVIIVLNKQREHSFDLNRHNLMGKFPGMIRKFIKTECDDPALNIGELKKAILYETDNLEGLRDGFPEEWFSIKDKLSSMKDNYLTFEKYREICAKLGEKAQVDQDKLAGYLHQLGIALNYKDDPRLRDMHVLNPHWVTEGIYTILNAKELEARKGELHINCLNQILDSKVYPRERHLFLLNLMRKFHLCFEFPDQKEHYLIPDLADRNQPDAANDFISKECLNFQYKYPSLHEGIIPSFITRTYILSEKQPRWRTGVILSFEGCRALIKGDLTDKLVSISVSGSSSEARRRLLAVIRTSFENIHNNFKFKPEELVPVPGFPDVTIPYKELLVMERKRIEKKQQVIGEEVLDLDVLELLNGVDLKGTRKPLKEDQKTEKKGLKIFLSYSHKDETLREELGTHLKILQRQGLIEVWHDRQIIPGEEGGKEIDKNLEDADIILLLISADFLASDYCYDIEMKRAMERNKNGEACVIPIILRESNWNGAPFGKLQALPKDGKPVVAYDRKDIAWNEISRKLEKIAEKRELKNPD